MPDKPKASDKAPWATVSLAIHRDTLRGAVAASEEWKEGRLDSVKIIWASQPKFLPDGTVESDSEEPGIPPVTVESLFVWQQPPPELPKEK